MKLKHLTTMSALLALATLTMASVANAQDGMKDMPGMGNMSRMDMPKTGTGKGVITAISAKDDKITIKHDAIPAVGWPAMTMTFKANPVKLLTGLKVGEKITFDVSVKGSDAEVTAIQPK